MDRGKTIGCGMILVLLSLATVAAFGGPGGIMLPIGAVLMIVGFCMKNEPKAARAYRRTPRPHHR